LKFLDENNVELLDWAAQSPDLNPIEHVWAIMKKKLGNYKFSDFDALKKATLDVWEKEVTVELCQQLIMSMPNRIAEVIKAKGGSTKY